VKTFNEKIALLVTRGVSTMWCAYLFAVLAVYGFPYHDLKAPALIQWMSQEFLQLVLLSVIMVGQKVQADMTVQLHQKVDDHHREHMRHLKRPQ
jgi:hypothetical protein